MKTKFPFFLAAMTISAALALPGSVRGADLNEPGRGPTLDQLQPRIEAALKRPELAAYRGWIKFLRFEAENAPARRGTNSEPPEAKTERLADWLGRIESNPQLLDGLRGVQEWAYESPADGTGQPFKIVIPTDYDPARPPALQVYMHGYSGNHMEHSTGMKAHPGFFEMAVLGRARGGWYTALSEADVLQAIDYVQSHWRIDPNRVELLGGSMGGGGTLRLASHYPHRFASGRISCGYGTDLPLGNLLTFPVYATHSIDDPTVPILTSRGPLNRLRELGGQVIFDETNGFGHAVWNYAEGNQRGEVWADKQVRPDSRQVRHLDFTALTGTAPRAWWAEVAEWGSAPKPARFILVAGADNTLYAELRNIKRLKLRIAESPFERSLPLRVSIGGAVPFEVPAPLSESVLLGTGPAGWHVETNEPPEISGAAGQSMVGFHSPGGPVLLYDGSPLLIVYGTQGNADTRAAMRSAAEAASKSPNSGWARDGGEAGSDGVPHRQILYGRLNVKSDEEVTESDLERCNLVLIGTAAQNRLVARAASGLPVKWNGGKILCSDGFQVDAADRTLGLVYRSPFAPRRLVYWVASELAPGYSPDNPVVQLGASNLLGADVVVMDLKQPRLVAARSFGSEWRWDASRTESPLLPDRLNSCQALAMGVADSVRRGAGAQFAVAVSTGSTSAKSFVTGTTRLADLNALNYNDPVGVMDITGSELLEMQRRLASASNREHWSRFYPNPSLVSGSTIYRVALSGSAVREFAQATKTAPKSFRMTDLQVSETLDRFLLSATETEKKD